METTLDPTTLGYTATAHNALSRHYVKDGITLSLRAVGGETHGTLWFMQGLIEFEIKDFAWPHPNFAMLEAQMQTLRATLTSDLEVMAPSTRALVAIKLAKEAVVDWEAEVCNRPKLIGTPIYSLARALRDAFSVVHQLALTLAHLVQEVQA